jgi:hypothetical protein
MAKNIHSVMYLRENMMHGKEQTLKVSISIETSKHSMIVDHFTW